MPNALEEANRLRRLTWAALQREGLEAGLPVARVSQARTRDELRLEILKARFPAADNAKGAPVFTGAPSNDERTP